MQHLRNGAGANATVRDVPLPGALVFNVWLSPGLPLDELVDDVDDLEAPVEQVEGATDREEPRHARIARPPGPDVERQRPPHRQADDHSPVMALQETVQA